MGGAILPELDVFVHLLILLRLIDTNNLNKVREIHQSALSKLKTLCYFDLLRYFLFSRPRIVVIV